MPVFTVKAPVDSSQDGSIYFAYEEANRVGNPSAFGMVYSGYRAYADGAPSAGGEWAIKVARDSGQQIRFEREYQILAALHHETHSQFQISGSPYPVYLLTDVEGRNLPAIAMPFYRHTVNDEIPTWLAQGSEAGLLDAMIAYAQMLSALKDVTLPGENAQGYVCLDRKPDDLRWEEQHLVVIDWNVIRPANDANIRTEISLFARTWYVLLTGFEITPSLNPYDDDEWKLAPTRLTGTPVNQPISVGLRAILGAANAGVYQSMDELRSDLEHWRGELQSAEFQQAFPYLSLSPERVNAIRADLEWRRYDGARAWEDRTAALHTAQAQAEDLADLRPALGEIERMFLEGNDDGADERIKAARPTNALQRVALARWAQVVSAYRGGGISSEQRSLLRDQRRAIAQVIKRLERPLVADHAAEVEFSLSAATDVLEKFIPILPKNAPATSALLALAYEVSLRSFWHEAQRGTKRREALDNAALARSRVPYAADLLEGVDLDAALEQAHAAQKLAQTLKEHVDAARQAVIGWMRPVLSGGTPTDSITVMRQTWTETQDTIRETSEDLAREFGNRLQPFNRVLDTLDWLPSASLDAAGTAYNGEQLVAAVADDAELSGAVKHVVAAIVTRKAEAEFRDADNRIARLRKADGAGAFYDAYRVMARLDHSDVTAWLPAGLSQRIRGRFAELGPLQQFYKSFEIERGRTAFEILAYAQSLGLSLDHPPLLDYIPEALTDGAKLTDVMQTRIDEAEGRQSKQIKQLDERLTGQLNGSVSRMTTLASDVQVARKQIEAEQGAKAAAEQLQGRISPLETQIKTLAETEIPALQAWRTTTEKSLSEQSGGARRLMPLIVGALIVAIGGALIGIVGIIIGSQAHNNVQAAETRAAAAVTALSATDVAQREITGQEIGAAEARAAQNDALMNGLLQGQADQISTLEAEVTRLSAAISTLENAGLPAPFMQPEVTAEITADLVVTEAPVVPTPEPTVVSVVPEMIGMRALLVNNADTPVTDELLYMDAASTTFTADFVGMEAVRNHLEQYPTLLEGGDQLFVLAHQAEGAQDVRLYPVVRVPETTTTPLSYRYVDTDGVAQTFAPLSTPFVTQIVIVTASDALAMALNAEARLRGGAASVMVGGVYLAQVDEQGRVVAIQVEDQRLAFTQWRVEVLVQSLSIRPEPSLDSQRIDGASSNNPATFPLSAAFTSETVGISSGRAVLPDRALGEGVIAIVGRDSENNIGNWLLVDRGETFATDRFGWVFSNSTTTRLSVEQVSGSAPLLRDEARLLIEAVAG